MVKNLGRKDLLEKKMASHSSIHSYLGNSTDRGAWWVHEVAKELDTT